MPIGQIYPFRRLMIDHMVDGVTRVWWEMEDNFTDDTPYVFQLQAGQTGAITATDWVDVGAPSINALYAEDDTRRLFGKRLITNYRVLLTTPQGRYVSVPLDVYGLLSQPDWAFAKEIVRKEQLRQSKVASDGLLLKRFRTGPKCTRCSDYLTDQVSDSRCPQCYGTGRQVGYFPPVPSQFWDLQRSGFDEKRNGAQPPGQSIDIFAKARALAFPDLALEDVWVNSTSDERWAVHNITVAAAWRGVPLIYDVILRMYPFSSVVYRIPIGGEPNDNAFTELPAAGSGCVSVDHDYGGEDNLAYLTADGCPIPGANVYAFTQAAYDAGARSPSQAVAASTTGANGRWNYAMLLDPGDYVIMCEKPGEYGPDTMSITVTDPASDSVGALAAPMAAPPTLAAMTAARGTGFGAF